ncbi:MAG TPA: PilZ domain-containing protein [Sphingomicrobium sp.]|nr:PilZ domain-containing protein [Sphingomicrobium sp.]
MLDEEPVETTLYSLDEAVPEGSDRRTGERHLSLLRVGTLTIGDRRELCLIRNISAGGMLVRAYCPIATGTRVTIELKQDEPIAGTARWIKGECVGVSFDRPIDVLSLLASSEDGPRPRMPRVEIDCTAWVRVGANVHRARAVDISQGGLKIVFHGLLPVKAEVVVSIAGLDPCPGMIRWNADGTCGITFNRVIPLPVLVAWLQDGRSRLRAAS